MHGVKTRKLWRGEILEPVTMMGHRGDAAVLGVATVGNIIAGVMSVKSGDLEVGAALVGAGVFAGLISAGEIMLDRLPDAPSENNMQNLPSSPAKLRLVPPLES